LSVSHRVTSPLTALVVLETERDYQRFGIDRRALADVLTVEGGRVAVARRSPRAEPREGERARGDEGGAGSQHAAGEVEANGVEPPAAPRPALAGAAPEPAATATASAAAAASVDLRAAAIASELADLDLRMVAALKSDGPRPSSAPPLARAASGGALASLGGAAQVGAAAAVRGPVGIASLGGASVSGGTVANAPAVVAGMAAGFRRCFAKGLQADPTMRGSVRITARIGPNGEVLSASPSGGGGLSGAVIGCVAARVASAQFAPPEGGSATIVVPVAFANDGPAAAAGGAVDAIARGGSTPDDPRPIAAPYVGRFKAVMDLLASGPGSAHAALDAASAWRREEPGDVMALVALGEALEANGERMRAARAYGSIIDLFPSRADQRRFAGERLERLGGEDGLDLAIDTFQKARAERPDHPASHRLLAYALLRRGSYAEAFDAALGGVRQAYPPGRFAGVERILREDLGLVAAAWIKAAPARRDEILARVREAGGAVEDEPSLRFVLTWETDANDVDFHVRDARGGHAFYGARSLPSGGELYADVTTGYGPECFTIRAPRALRAGPYALMAHYYARGPMGFGMGTLEIVDHDGHGGLSFDVRPFVIQVDGAYVDLGTAR
jgi:hypothetical protein